MSDIERQSVNPQTPPQELLDYTETLFDLRDYLADLRLENDPPKENVNVIPGTESPGRPIGALLPIYPEEECGIDEKSFPKTLFNLYSLVGFRPQLTRI